jgi:hypothetical protein
VEEYPLGSLRSAVYSRARSTVLSFSFARSASLFRSTPSALAHLSMASRSQPTAPGSDFAGVLDP